MWHLFIAGVPVPVAMSSAGCSSLNLVERTVPAIVLAPDKAGGPR
jgi:hypothetical protein